VFENLIAQEDICRALASDILKGELPPSMLFTGPENSGKLTAALETARILSCETGQAGWNCPCPACERHRKLSHPDLLLMGPRSFRAEILAAGQLLNRNPNRAARYLFYRAIKKLTRRFDPVLYEGEESRLSKAASLLQSLEEFAQSAGPDGESSNEASDIAAKVLPLADKLEALLPDSLPIIQVREAVRWARLAPFGRRKVVIVENAERMLESARNALLKILEEPPNTASFILLSPRPSALIPTVLSRTRSYPFRARDAEASKEILSKVFRAEPLESGFSLDSFLAARKPLSHGETDALAVRFLSALCAQLAKEGFNTPPALQNIAEKAQDGSATQALSALAAATKNFGSGDEALAYVFPSFLRSLSGLFRPLLRGGDAETADLLTFWSRFVRDAMLRFDTYNIAPTALMERLVEQMVASLRSPA